MIEIIPAVLEPDLDSIEERVELVKSLVPLVQLDVCDGRFVGNKTWPYKSDGTYDDYFLDILEEAEGLPFWKEVDYEIDLMVSNPEEAAEDWITAGAKRLVFHVKSLANPEEFLSGMRKRFPKGGEGPFDMEIGIAIDSDSNPQEIYSLIDYIDFVQCMGIRKVGFQGEPFDDRKVGFQGELFDDEVLVKLQQLKVKYPELPLSVDGGISLETASQIVDAGATRLISGSFIFESENIKETIDYLSNL
jgi:ribulose-phosphate 3-epimerase